MTMPELCPSCLTELPDGYPYDHVAIDQVLTGRYRHLFEAMTTDERREVVATGLARRMSVRAIADRIDWPYNHIAALLPDEHPNSIATVTAGLEQQIRELYDADLPDVQIGLRVGRNAGDVGRIRKRLRLPTKFGPGGRRLVTS